MQINSPTRGGVIEICSQAALARREEWTSVMRVRHGTLLLNPSRSAVARAIFAVAFSLLPSVSMAQDAVKLNEAQAQNIGVRVTHPVSSRSDQTCPIRPRSLFQRRIVGRQRPGFRHGHNLWVGRGDRIRQAWPSSRWKARLVSQSSATICTRSHRKFSPPAAQAECGPFRGQGRAATRAGGKPSEARQASIVVAERRQMLRLSGLSEEAFFRLTNDAGSCATLTVNAPQAASWSDAMSPATARTSRTARQAGALSPLWAEIAFGVEHPSDPHRRKRRDRRYATPG